MKKAIVGHSVRFTFDGGLPDQVFNADQASAENRHYAMMDRFMNRIGDNAALSRKQKDGSVVTITEKMRWDSVKEIIDHLHSGSTEWNLKGDKKPLLVLEAIARHFGCDYAEAERKVGVYAGTKLNGDKGKALAKFQSYPEIQEAMLQISRERIGPAVIDADSEIDELGKL